MNLRKKLALKTWASYCSLLRRTHVLNYLFWETTLGCNLSCRHCGSNCGPKKDRASELNTEEVINCFKKIARDYVASKIMVAITGGEPFLREDLFVVTEQIQRLGFPWGIVTNGTLITKEIVAKSYLTGMGSLTVSLDGMENEHNFLRLGDSGNAFKKAIEGFELFTRANFPQIREFACCVNQYNIGSIEKIFDMAVNLNATHLRYLIISPIGRSTNDKKLFLEKEQFTELLNFIKTKRNNQKKIKINFDDEGFLGIDWEKEVRDTCFFCGAGVNIGSILHNGDISACPNIDRRFIQGNIRDNDFSYFWEKKFEKFRDRDWMKNKLCGNCQWWNECKGNSLHLWNCDKNEPAYCLYKKYLKQAEG